MNILKTSSLTIGVFIMSLAASALIVNSRATMTMTSSTVIDPTSIFKTSVEEDRFEQWRHAVSNLDKYRNPLNQHEEYTAEKRELMLNKFKDEQLFLKEIKKVNEKIKILSYF